MHPQPILATPRLRLRPFAAADAADVEGLAGDRRIAETTLVIPHPYLPGMASTWIATHAPAWQDGSQASFAITRAADGGLLGAISLVVARAHDSGELGYWVGVPWWNQGICTEAAHALVAFGFDHLGLNRIHAHHLARNPASGRVMRKLGMRHEGSSRQAVKKWDRYEDIERYAILRGDPRG